MFWGVEAGTELFDKLGPVDERLLKVAGVDAEKVGDDLADVGVAHDGGILVRKTVDDEFEVAELEDGSDGSGRRGVWSNRST